MTIPIGGRTNVAGGVQNRPAEDGRERMSRGDRIRGMVA